MYINQNKNSLFFRLSQKRQLLLYVVANILNILEIIYVTSHTQYSMNRINMARAETGKKRENEAVRQRKK